MKTPLTFGNRLFLPICLIAWLCAHTVSADTAPAQPPNIVFILADDLGIDGVSCYGSDTHKTPNVDKLAASGLRFETCYAAPFCGPSRCLLMTGRFAFRTGGLGNRSWASGGPGAKSANEWSIAKVLKQSGYVTGQAGKWRQLGETPHDWGFDEYCSDNAPAGWYWEDTYEKNGKTITAPKDTYNPDIIQDFSIDFMTRHKDQPFFLYYAMHLVHTPTVHTPDSSPGAKDGPECYDDNITYMDKQVGDIVAAIEKLGLRGKTLILFAGDNGTEHLYPSTVRGRMLDGCKGTMQEGGSRVPYVASWPGTTQAGKVSMDIVSFADQLPTFAELGGAPLPPGVKIDGQSIAPLLRGQAGNPRTWAYVQRNATWYVREQGWKLNQEGEFFDMSDAPYAEKLVAPGSETAAAKEAKARLTAILTELNPAAGKTEGDTSKKAKKAAKGKGAPAAPAAKEK